MARKEAEAVIVKYIEKITQDKDLVELYKDMFKSMSNKDFDDFMEKLKSGEEVLQVIIPNGKKTKMSLENNMKIADELGKSFFQRLKYPATVDMPAYKSRNQYLVIKMPIFRVSQLLKKKISYCEDSKVIDNRTGQVTGRSMSATITNPEVSMLAAYGFEDLLEEFLKYRGGDQGARQAMNKTMYSNGTASMRELEPFTTGTKANQTLEQYYLGMGIRSSINKGKR